MDAALLEVEDLAKRYGSHAALDGVSLAVRPGEICGLLGPNGAGKTTLVSIVAGLRSADSGRVHLAGSEVTSGARACRELVGLAAQETGVYPTVTVRENLLLFAELAGLRGPRREERIDQIADTLELGGLMDRLARHLSGGEQRRLHTAMALVHAPPVVLLDEPTTGVDVATRARLLDAVSAMAREEGTAVVYSTHYLPEVEQLDANVVLLDRGRVLAEGPVSELIEVHGRGVVEVTLSGTEDPGVDGAEVEVGPATTVLRFRTENPGPLLADAMVRLGRDAERVVSVEVLRSSLEGVFLALTGRRIGDESHADHAVPGATHEGSALDA